MILYLGNNLSRHGNTPTGIETLGKLLSLTYDLRCSSSRQNIVLRWLDMMLAILRYRRSIKLVMIDTYSSLGFYYALGAAIICRLLDIKYVPILRGGNLEERLRGSVFASRLVFGGAHLLIAPSNYLLATFNKFGFAKIRYIPNSIEVGHYEQREKKSVAARLLWVRSFHEVYNPLMAIKVLQKVLDVLPNAELVMVGPDKDGTLAKCKAYAHELGIEKSVRFTGLLSKTDWHLLADSYDIFINTTTVDNTPVSVIEAMALGLPVVSTNVGGIPYLITDADNGILVDSDNPEQMADKIIFLASNPEYAIQMARKARASIEQFDWNNVKDKWFNVLDEFEARKNAER